MDQVQFSTCAGEIGYVERLTAKNSTQPGHILETSRKGFGYRSRCLGAIRPETFAAEVERNVRLVAPPDMWKERFLAKVEIGETEESTAKQAKLENLRVELKTTKAKIDRLNNGFTDGSIDLAEFKELKNPLIPRKVELESPIIALEKTKANRVEPLRNWILEANRREKLVSEGNFGEMKSFLQQVGLNRVFRDETLTVSFVKPWDSLAQTVTTCFGDNEFPGRAAMPQDWAGS